MSSEGWTLEHGSGSCTRFKYSHRETKNVARKENVAKGGEWVACNFLILKAVYVLFSEN